MSENGAQTGFLEAVIIPGAMVMASQAAAVDLSLLAPASGYGNLPLLSTQQNQQAFSATDIKQAMYILGLNTPDENWYMDTGATSHMTSSAGLSDREASSQLYPFTTTTNHPVRHHYNLSTLFPSLWHARLGYPGTPVIVSLKKNSFIDCNQRAISDF
ncbi:hypothetical protein LIER_38685 [Lithospermum erythrorhizon]|uniref:GAG-pre-integrase domain-containing protein n=1 Tax=Lithospermum erythrorhizon TaxID=34254 RepID=A0AAV3Q4X1_LITER